MAYHKLLAIGYAYVLESERKLEEREYSKTISFYKSKEECKASAELLTFLHSLKINFGTTYIEMSEITGFFGKYKASNRELSIEGDAYVYFRSFLGSINSIIVLIILNPKYIATDELILFQNNGLLYIDGMSLENFLTSLLPSLKLKYKEPYNAVFLEETEKPEDKELYGLIESDPGYTQANLNVVNEVISKNASMIEGIDLFYSKNNMTVMFYSEPLDKFMPITNLSLNNFPENIANEFKECKNHHENIDPLLPVFIDYLVEIEPLRLQHFLLSVYEIKMKLSQKTKNQMAKLKAELTEMLDFYYAIASTIYKGVERAMVIGEREMGIDDLRFIFNEKISLLSESIEMSHELELERWNMLFTYTLAAMGFASLLDAFLTTFFKWEGPVNVAILLVFGSFIFILLASYFFSRLIKKK